MALSGPILFLFLFSAVIAENKMWWLTGTPFVTEKSAPAPRSTCQCVRKELCLDVPEHKKCCEKKGEMCCENLKMAEPFIARPERSNSRNELGSNSNEGHLDLYAEDIVGSEYNDYDNIDAREELKESSTICTTTTTEATPESPVYDFDSDDFEGTAGPDATQKCGVATPHLLLEEKQSNGYDPYSRFAEYPWTLLILESQDGVNSAVCAGALLYPRFAVTAAHCIQGRKVKNLIVRAGEWDIMDKDDEPLSHIDSRVSSVVIHRDFKKEGLHNDIALLVLEGSFKPTPHIGHLCLPEKNEKFTDPCIATGWGMRGSEISPEEQSKMKRVQVKLVKRKPCENALRATGLGSRFGLSSTAICAAPMKKGEDTSQGDGGGPLFCTSTSPSKHFSLVGIVSWGKKNSDAPGVYTSVRKYREWIKEEIATVLDM